MTPVPETLDFSALSEGEIEDTLEEHNIPLKVEEALKIQNEIVRRPPTFTECVLWSIQGSEHSSYKSSRIHLEQLVSDGPTVILGPSEDAGIVAVARDNGGTRYGIVMSHESHNHPSQIVPYEGAATGIGGIVRDVVCMGAKVIAVADGLRFGRIESPRTKWIHEGVVGGIAGYGNPIGVPNLAGDLYYDEGYDDNCLVSVVSLGIVREDEVIHSAAPQDPHGYHLILVGKATDNSGFGGASFASLELNEEEKEAKKAAVQEPNAFLERHLLKATYALLDILREKKLLNKVGFKDLGAGGIACASVELADSAGCGAKVFLDEVHLGMKGLHPSVILCSETQERLMWVSHPDVSHLIVDHYNRTFDLPNTSTGAEARIIGKIRRDRQYVVHSNGQAIVDAPADQITKGFLYDRSYSRTHLTLKDPELPHPADLNETLLKIVSHENVASRLPVFETYDKQVQGRTCLESGEADAGVMEPFNDDSYPEEIRDVGIALSVDHNPRYCKIDPYWGAVNAVVESMRNVAAVGATPQAITDCLCFGNPEKEDQMGQFVEAVRGVAEACRGIHLKEYPDVPVPIVSGNVSFYNESRRGPIPPSPIVSCLGRMPQASKAITPHFKKSGSPLLLVGDRKDECGGSIYYALHSELGANVPRPDLHQVEQQIYAITEAVDLEFLLACHDISEGGVATALTEMSFHNNLGCHVDIPGDLPEAKRLLSETGGFVVEAVPRKLEEIKSVFESHHVSFHEIGITTEERRLRIGANINLPVSQARAAWSQGLRGRL